MSGFEIVGVVLGGLPLIIKAAQDYREGFEPFVKWRRFRCEFRAFINDVDLEKQLFDCLVERLLEYADLSVEQKQGLLTGLDPDGWRQTDVKKASEVRLGGSCAVFLQLLEAIGDDFIKLQAMMSLKDGSIDWAEEGKDKWNYQRKRISYSFNKKGPATVVSLGEKNRKVRDLLDALDVNVAVRQSNRRKAITNDTTWARIFECIRHQANSLHSAIRNGWKCSCETPHLATLQLQERATGDWSSHFIMTFTPTNGHQKALKFRRRVIVTVKQSKAMEPSVFSRPHPTPIQEGYLNKLRVDFDIKSASKSDKQALNTRSNPHSVSAPLPPSLSSVPKSSKTVKRIAFASTTQLKTEKTSHSVSDLWRGQQAKKTICMSLPQKEDLEKTAHENVPTDLAVKPPLLCGHTASTQDNPEIDTEIEDLCSILETLQPSVTCLGYLSDDEHRHHQLRLIKDSKLPSDRHDLISLEKLLNNATKPSLNRKQRFRLTIVLASSLLQLQTTPWLTEKLEKKDIYFEYHGREVLADQPYIYHFFPSTKLPSVTSSDAGVTPPTSGFATRASLTNLGILLLELCFGQAIETIDHRNEFLVDGKPHNQTDYLTAIEWISEVEQEAGLDFQNAIRCCFGFDIKPNWTDAKFTQSIYAGVVQPLEKVVAELGWADASS